MRRIVLAVVVAGGLALLLTIPLHEGSLSGARRNAAVAVVVAAADLPAGTL